MKKMLTILLILAIIVAAYLVYTTMNSPETPDREQQEQEQEVAEKTATATFSTDPELVEVAVGETFSVDAILSVENGRSVSVDMRMLYDPTVLEVVDIMEDEDGMQVGTGSLFGGNYVMNTVDEDEGLIRVSAANMDPDKYFSGSDIFATVTFQAIAPSEKAAVYFDYQPFEEQNTSDTDVMLEKESIDVLNEVRGTTVVVSE